MYCLVQAYVVQVYAPLKFLRVDALVSLRLSGWIFVLLLSLSFWGVFWQVLQYHHQRIDHRVLEVSPVFSTFYVL